MSKTTTTSRTNLKPVPDAAASEKPKKERKPRVSKPADFNSQLRLLAEGHRSKLAKLVTAEQKAAAKLAELRTEREAAEGPLREVEAILARRSELPLDQPSRGELEGAGYADDVNQ